jgi:DNA polymerase-4
MHVDMDAFYASVEQRDNPALKGRPVIVGGLSDRGVVATASYEARKFGIHSAMSMRQARRLCPNGVFLPVRMSHYRRISHQIRLILSHYSPFIEPLALDEAFLDISGMELHYSHVTDIAKAAKKDIYKTTGLIASAGIGPNKFLAKLASDLRKPDGLVWIPYGTEQAMLAPLSVSRLWGVGNVTEQALRRAGFKTIGDIASAGPDALRPVVGNQAGRIYDLSLGKDKRPLEISRRPQSVGNEHTYDHDLLTPAEAEEQLRILANEVSWRLRQNHLMGRTITLKVRFASFQTITRSLTWEGVGTCAEEQLYFAARRLYQKRGRNEPIRLLGLTVSQLQRYQVQGDLFSDDDDTKAKVTEAIDTLQKRFGRNALMKGFLWELSHEKEK